MNIYQIKEAVKGNSHFFDRATMRGASQTLKSFHVNKTSMLGVYYVYANYKDITTGQTGLTERWYNERSKKLHLRFDSAACDQNGAT